METLKSIQCDLATYKITLQFHGRKSLLVVHFDTPSRRFYFSLIILIITEMKKRTGKVGAGKGIWVSAAVLSTLIIAVFVWRGLLSETPEPVDKVDLGYAVYPDYSKPSIAVLPFHNISGDSEQQYFCDGMTEQLITALSQGPYLYVTSRTSSSAFKGTDLTIQQIADKLGVRYLLEGSVQRDSDLVRINVQLIDSRSGNHIWAEYYDHNYEDLFAIQDEITMKILAALNIEVTGFKTANLKNARPSNLKAYEHFLKGLYYYLGRRGEDIDKARAALQEAIDLDPEFAKAYTFMGFVYMDEIIIRKTKTPERVFEEAEQMAEKAIELDPENPPYTLLSQIYREKKEFESAILYGKKGVTQDPNDAYRYLLLGLAQRYAENYEDAIATLKTAIRLVPFRPVHYILALAWAYMGNRQFHEAIELFIETIDRSPESRFAFDSYLGLAGAYELTGDHEKASEAARKVMQKNPKFSLDIMYKTSTFKDGPVKETIYTAFRKAGLM